MIRLRFLLIVIIIVITGVILQTFKVINFGDIFRMNTRISTTAEPTGEVVSASTLPENPDMFFLFYTSAVPDDVILMTQLRAVLNSAHVQYRTADLHLMNGAAELAAADSGDSLIASGPAVERLAEELPEQLSALVSRGTSLTVLSPVSVPTSPLVQELCGITDLGGTETVSGHNGVFKQPFFPVLDELAIPAAGTVRTAPDLEEHADILAEYEDGIPLIWTIPYGQASVLHTNSTLLTRKENRGLLLQLILLNNDCSCAFIQGDSLLSILDFPSPLPEGKIDFIFSDYQRDTGRFYREIWWSNIETLQKRYAFGLTGFASSSSVQNQDNAAELLKTYAHLLGAAGGEIGLQFNLAADEAVEPAAAAMLSPEIETFRNLLQKAFGETEYRSFLTTGHIAADAAESQLLQIQNSFTGLRVAAGAYTDAPAAALSRSLPLIEAGEHPELNALTTYPFFSGGYAVTDDSLWAMANGIAEQGIFHHVVTPLSLLGTEGEEERRWSKLLIEFEKLIRKVHTEFPFLQAQTLATAAAKLKTNSQMVIHSSRENNVITISLEKAVLPLQLYLHSQYPIKNIRGGILRPTGREQLYILEAREPELTITMRR